jgi:beta-lactamase superfamily II metal-dependent hydrolase
MMEKEGIMAKDLLVRLFRVGFGDCIFLQIPDKDKLFTVLIDCGTSAPAKAVLKPAVKHLIENLPKDEEGNPHLDLMMVTHPHSDHIKGFDPTWFKGVTIDRIWMSAFMDLAHPKAQKALAFEQNAFLAAKSLLERSGLQFTPDVRILLERSLSLCNSSALSALRESLPTGYPRLYVARDVAEHLSDAVLSTHNLSIENGVTSFSGFSDEDICLRILAPEWDIDGTYLGKFSADDSPFTDPLIFGTSGYDEEIDVESLLTEETVNLSPDSITIPEPENISSRDFRMLRNRLLYSAIAFSQEDDALKNDVSVVFLLEWHGKRLLFTGDAEWRGNGVEAGRRNSSWDVMMGRPEVKDLLLQPLDFFKVAHHGSFNGSPFDDETGWQLIEKMVTPDRTHVVISTETEVHNNVPFVSLMKKLGELAKNKQIYSEGELELIGVPQPRRTDRESDSSVVGVNYIEEVFSI